MCPRSFESLNPCSHHDNPPPKKEPIVRTPFHEAEAHGLQEVAWTLRSSGLNLEAADAADSFDEREGQALGDAKP